VHKRSENEPSVMGKSQIKSHTQILNLLR